MLHFTTNRLCVCMATMLMANIHVLYAQNTENPNVSPADSLSEFTVGNFNVKQFEVKVENSQEHYVQFWLRPAKHADNQYTKFYVYLNNHYAGSITPNHGNWQAAHMDGVETLRLSEGTNTIAIATMAPEMPDVESVKIALSREYAKYSTEDFENYLEEAIEGYTYDVPENGISAFADSSVGTTSFSNIPLNYSFFATYSFTKDQQVIILSDSQTEHLIDVMFYGTSAVVGQPSLTRTISSNVNTTVASNNSFGAIPDDGKFVTYINYATSQEMQGLSWLSVSETALNTNKQVASVVFTAPKTGIYLVRLRSKDNGVLGVANLNVNGMYIYEDAPIFYACVPYVIPSDGNQYETMTCCANPGTDDPVLFIQGAEADRLVGVNDDGPSAKLKQYGLSKREAFISQQYLVRTSAISVGNYNSQKPISECTIIVKQNEADDASTTAKYVKSQDTQTTGISNTKSIGFEVNQNVHFGKSLQISSGADVRRVDVYNASGVCVGSVQCDSNSVVVPLSSINISQGGFYVLRAETTNGVIIRKILVK